MPIRVITTFFLFPNVGTFSDESKLYLHIHQKYTLEDTRDQIFALLIATQWGRTVTCNELRSFHGGGYELMTSRWISQSLYYLSEKMPLVQENGWHQVCFSVNGHLYWPWIAQLIDHEHLTLFAVLAIKYLSWQANSWQIFCEIMPV